MLILLLPLSAFSQGIKMREYKVGTETEYRLTSESYNNDKFSGKSISVARLTVVADSAILSEEIKWLSKTSFSDKDTINKDKAAQSIDPYRISLLPTGKILLPKLNNPEMVGDITDLNTFFVAVSPALHIDSLNRKSPVYKNEKTTSGNFADGVRILKGSDCTEVTQTLVKKTKKYTIVKTDFLPPLANCLVPLLDTIAKKVLEYPNNFQMVQNAQAGKVNLIWGNESFTIITKIDNKDGKVLDATMTNVLNLRMRINASADLQTYAVEIPYKILRNLKLELIKETK
jgi:hypothetical protein